MERLQVSLRAFEGIRGGGNGSFCAARREEVMEFHICREVREACGLERELFSLQGNVILADFRQVRELTAKLNEHAAAAPGTPPRFIRAGELNAMGLIDEILHYLAALYREQVQGDVFETALAQINERLGSEKTGAFLEKFCTGFPPRAVYGGEKTVGDYLEGREGRSTNRALTLEEILLLAMANLNPAFRPFLFLFDDSLLARETIYPQAIEELKAHLASLPGFGPDGMNLWDLLRAPALASPDSLSGQLDYMRKRWGLLISKYIGRLLTGIDVIKEEEKPSFFGPGPQEALSYGGLENEYEKFSPDQDWMPRTVLLAKSTLVWLYQLSKKYAREITRLDQIPDEELDILARRGFTGLWLIGLWERSTASRKIKQWMGNPEAAASAYSLYDYDIARELGGWESLVNLRERCMRRGIRLGSDMVPNHTGIDSRWIMEHPDRFLQLPYSPYPGYVFKCENLSGREDVTVQIEDHYFNHSDAAVVFRRIDNRTGETRFIYHGNDGTSMPWNDTAQIDFLNPGAREAVIRTIIGVCQQFSIVRFDAAMTLAKRHIQRLWYPEPGHGGDIASRAEHAISMEEFNRRIPNEFWREVVDRCAVEAPHTLLLAEAFWMMEGYFVRTLGMHRVYNSAFMNMLKMEENGKYRATIKNTLEFDPEILKRFVNFMNNPDEETAVAQFGKGDKYFGIATLLVTMPGLPMFGHGQIEGFEEKYGMEYRRSYRDETPDQALVDRHEREIFPLMKRRHLFSGSADFCLYDFIGNEGVNENVFAYSNRAGDERALVFYNNSYTHAAGWIHWGAVNIPQKDGSSRKDSLCQALGLHGEECFFVLLREQRSNLWYIRSSKEIAERGLFAALSGYEAQVFLDIHEVEDVPGAEGGCWNTRWARLNAELSGRGVPNPEDTILDIFLGGLYGPLKELFRPDRIRPDRMKTLFLAPRVTKALGAGDGQKPTPPSPKGARAAFIASLKEPFLDFTQAALDYIAGAEGRYDPFTTEKPLAPIKPEAIWKEFAAFLERFFHLLDTPTPAPGAADKSPRYRFVTEVQRGLQRGTAVLRTDAASPIEGGHQAAPWTGAVVLGYGVLTLLRSLLGKGASGAEAAALFDHWRLDRKLRECWEALGVPGDEAWLCAEVARAVLARTAPAEGFVPALGGSTAALAAGIIMENYQEEDFRRILGVNRFNGITWFNKERFEASLFYGTLFLALEADGAFTGIHPAAAKGFSREERLDLIAEVKEELQKAEEESAYQLDALLNALVTG